MERLSYAASPLLVRSLLEPCLCQGCCGQAEIGLPSPILYPPPPPSPLLLPQILASAKEAAAKSSLPADQAAVDELSGGTGDFFKVGVSRACPGRGTKLVLQAMCAPLTPCHRELC